MNLRPYWLTFANHPGDIKKYNEVALFKDDQDGLVWITRANAIKVVVMLLGDSYKYNSDCERYFQVVKVNSLDVPAVTVEKLGLLLFAYCKNTGYVPMVYREIQRSLERKDKNFPEQFKDTFCQAAGLAYGLVFPDEM